MIRKLSPANRTAEAAAERGFTLLEVLVTLMLLSLLAAAVFASFRTSLNSYERSQDRVEDEARRRTLQDYLKRQVGSLYPVRPSGSSIEAEGAEEEGGGAFSQVPLFYGDVGSVVFATVAPLTLLENPGLTVVRYGLSQDLDGTYFLGAVENRYTGQESFTAMVQAPEGSPIPLVEQVSTLSFQYYGYDQQSESYLWFDTWMSEETGSVPRAIRINFDDQHLTVPVNASQTLIARRAPF